ncbi:MAG: dUTP diphosphatase [Eubacteriaceae bacterium]|nr:dUTP diphosphatase [Eubacteriaceae bacterium]
MKIFNASEYSLPEYQTIGSVGVDLKANIAESILLQPRQVYQIPTGLFLEIPVGIEAQVRARSGLALKHGLSLVNGIGTIDSDFRGEIKVIMIVLIDKTYELKPGERIAQMVFSEVIKADFSEVTSVEALETSDRGSGGFGHSGKE